MVARWCPEDGGGGDEGFAEAFINVRVLEARPVLNHFMSFHHLMVLLRKRVRASFRARVISSSCDSLIGSPENLTWT